MKYDKYLQSHISNVQNWRVNRRAEKPMDYVPWLRQQLMDVKNCTLKRLADGPKFEAISYTSYAVNGYVFYTADAEMNKITQNSEVSVKVMTICKSSVKDKNHVVEEVTYYGIVK